MTGVTEPGCYFLLHRKDHGGRKEGSLCSLSAEKCIIAECRVRHGSDPAAFQQLFKQAARIDHNALLFCGLIFDFPPIWLMTRALFFGRDARRSFEEKHPGVKSKIGCISFFETARNQIDRRNSPDEESHRNDR